MGIPRTTNPVQSAFCKIENYLPLIPASTGTAFFAVDYLRIRKLHENLRMTGASHRNGVNYPSGLKNTLFSAAVSSGFRLVYEINENQKALAEGNRTLKQAICDTAYDTLSNGAATLIGAGVAEGILSLEIFGIAMTAPEIWATGFIVTAIATLITLGFDQFFQVVKEDHLKQICGPQ